MSETNPMLRVLVVDDHEDSCELFRTVLVEAGHHVSVAGDGEAGLAALVAERYDVAFIDVGLPLINGYELARRVRTLLGAQTPRLVATTGFAAPRDREEALDAGFDIHLAKPVEIASLLGALVRAPIAKSST
jgi:CheY-like chemotaxis protein